MDFQGDCRKEKLKAEETDVYGSRDAKLSSCC
jgi:hypothetical protein